MIVTFRNILVDQNAKTGLIRKLLLFCVFFPFVPSIIRSADTQPTFTLLLAVATFYVFLNKKERLFDLRNVEGLLLFIAFFIAFFSIILNFLYSEEPFYVARIFAFFQFALALLFGLTFRFNLEENDFRRVLVAYVLFTLLFFVSRGFVEDLLIGSRNESSEALMSTGRGAKTLSPEPSFFALQIFNIIIIYFLLFYRCALTKEKIILYLSFFCLLASFSGYGILILLALLFVRYTKLAISSVICFFLLMPVFLPSLDAFKYIRAVGLILTIFAKNPFLVFQQDQSILVRLASFFEYLENIQSHLWIGDGFALLKGGGFISLVSSMGLIAVLFFFLLIFEILFLKGFSVRKRMLLLFWFILNLLSGPIAVPAIGVIIGLIFRNNHRFLVSPVHPAPSYAK